VKQYTAKEVPSLEPRIDRRVGDMIDLIESEYIAKTKPVDLATIVQYFTLDSLTDIGK
jgi:hypothetical protein